MQLIGDLKQGTFILPVGNVLIKYARDYEVPLYGLEVSGGE